MKVKILEFQAQVCKTFSNAKRLEILNLLKAGEMTVSDITNGLKTPKANTSQHLRVMRMMGLLKTRRDGTNIYYGIANEKLINACSLMQEALAQIMDGHSQGFRAEETLSM
jgi:ArsR family transcriptional regulator, virulence genes transcriptional regulator